MVSIAALVLLLAQPSAVDAAEARAAFETGVGLVEAGAHAAALGPLRRAYQLSGHRPSTPLALAQCERALERTVDALVHYRELERTTDDEAQRERALATIALLEQQVAQAERAAVDPSASLVAAGTAQSESPQWCSGPPSGWWWSVAWSLRRW